MEELLLYLELLWIFIRTFWPIIVFPIICILIRRAIENRRAKKEADYIAKKIAEEINKTK